MFEQTFKNPKIFRFYMRWWLVIDKQADNHTYYVVKL